MDRRLALSLLASALVAACSGDPAPTGVCPGTSCVGTGTTFTCLDGRACGHDCGSDSCNFSCGEAGSCDWTCGSSCNVSCPAASDCVVATGASSNVSCDAGATGAGE
jgi:hypothetical protein